MCLVFSSLPQSPLPQLYESVYTYPIIEWFDSAAPGSSLEPHDISALISLCAFHTLVKATQTKDHMSPVCDLFVQDESGETDNIINNNNNTTEDHRLYSIFEQYTHFTSLQKYYNTGPGSPLNLGPVQGVGYINELISRLTGEPVKDSTQTNRTLDEDEETFPIGRYKDGNGRFLYVDFSHDNLMIAVYAAMGLDFGVRKGTLYNAIGDPEAEESEIFLVKNRYISSRIVSFGAEMVVERMECAVDTAQNGEKEIYIRILINDELQPLPFCSASKFEVSANNRPNTFDEDNDFRHKEYMCTLDDFVESQAYARGNGMGDWERCFESAAA